MENQPGSGGTDAFNNYFPLIKKYPFFVLPPPSKKRQMSRQSSGQTDGRKNLVFILANGQGLCFLYSILDNKEEAAEKAKVSSVRRYAHQT